MAKKKQTTSGGTATAAIERQDSTQRAQLVRSGLEKLNQGEILTSKERMAVKQWEQTNLDKWGRQFVAACPKRDYCEQTGISQKVALEQSRRFGLPYHTSGATIDLFAQLGAVHAWFSANKHAITRFIKSKEVADIIGDEEGLEFWQRELVKERAIRERDARQERQRELLPRDLIHQYLQDYYVTDIRQLIEFLDGRDESVCAEIADRVRDIVHNFGEGTKTLFGDDEEEES